MSSPLPNSGHKKLRVAVVTPYFPVREAPYKGHLAYQTLRRMTQLAEIEVFCPLSTYPSWLTPRSFKYVRADLSYSPPDVRAHYFPYPAIPVLTRPLNGWLAKQRVMPYLRRFQPDVIVNYWLYPEGYAAVQAGRQLRVPVIVFAIGSDLRVIPDAITRRFTQATVQQAAHVLTASGELRVRALALGAPDERVSTMLNGVDPSLFALSSREQARQELGVAPDAEIVLFVGTLNRFKGVGELLSATVRLVGERPRLQTVCIGEGVLRGELESALLERGLQDHFRLVGTRDSRGVAQWLAASNLFCLPSYSEGTPNAISEALACGRPVVSTRVGGIPEQVDSSCGLLVEPRNADLLTAALRQALDQPWDEQAIAARHSRTWDDVAADLYALCQRVVHQHTALK